jgi:hypothetical protein
LTTYVLALVVSSGIAFAIWNRGAALISLAMLLLLPTLSGMALINLWLFPIDIAIERQGWAPGASDVDQETARALELLRELDPVIGVAEWEPPDPLLGAARDDAPGRLPLSMPKRPSITFEGVGIALAFAALLAYHLYTAFERCFR